MKLSIPKPCHENWDVMPPDEKGKFCSVCSKSVHDFTCSSDEEIVAAFSRSENVCGRFNENQLNRNLNGNISKILAGLMLTSGAVASAHAQQTLKNNPKNQLQNIKPTMGKVKQVSLRVDTLKKPPRMVLGAPIRSETDVQQKPLYVYKDNIISETKFRNIDSNKIKKVTVLKGEKAVKKYGSKAKYGAIEID
ncbi:hypothetical protein [uncultured Chryseobacterium sp.]|uniref:hypothetical protein n=1 Tax=uncultured Chryseobacterium sp. TaxID=259322 RepID=UPI0026208053|nr:hypothetical protein [uncultured Chryseobacterium sp.]